ncbi:MAG: hypothetical protein MZV49_06025 [Rhodopseudomonas palustris]|nr:hypothetical protein [Rhodopseudomonas palustris]
MLRPFVYRRYLDFSVFESLREMKDLIAREVERRELQRQRQARSRRHPRDRVHRAGVPADPRRRQAARCRRAACSRRCRCWPARSCCPATRGRRTRRRRTDSCGASRTACRSATTSRRTTCRRTSRRAHGSRSRWVRRTGRRWRRELERHRRRVSAHFRALIFGPGGSPARPTARSRARVAARAGARRCAAPRAAAQRCGIGDRRARCSRSSNVLRESAYYRRLDETGRRRLQTLLPSAAAAPSRGGDGRGDGARRACCT